MRLRSKLVVAGLCVLAVTGVATAAEQKMHVMKVKLPDGSVGKVRYAGDVPPRIVFLPIRRAALPDLLADEASAAPFASFDRIFAEMNRRADAMLRQAAALSAQSNAGDGQVRTVSVGSMPPGAVQYSFVSTTTPRGTCSRSVQITSQGEGKPAKVVSQTSGDCGSAPAVPHKPSAPQQKGANAAPQSAKPVDARDTI